MIGEKMRQRGASISLGRDLSHADVMPPSPALSAITVPGVHTKDHSWILTEPGVGCVKCGVLSKCFILWVCRFVIVIFFYVRVPVFLAVLYSYVSVCLIYLSVRLSVCLPPIPPSLSLFRSPLSLTSYLSLSLSFFVSDRKYA